MTRAFVTGVVAGLVALAGLLLLDRRQPSHNWPSPGGQFSGEPATHAAVVLDGSVVPVGMEHARRLQGTLVHIQTAGMSPVAALCAWSEASGFDLTFQDGFDVASLRWHGNRTQLHGSPEPAGEVLAHLLSSMWHARLAEDHPDFRRERVGYHLGPDGTVSVCGFQPRWIAMFDVRPLLWAERDREIRIALQLQKAHRPAIESLHAAGLSADWMRWLLNYRPNVKLETSDLPHMIARYVFEPMPPLAYHDAHVYNGRLIVRTEPHALAAVGTFLRNLARADLPDDSPDAAADETWTRRR